MKSFKGRDRSLYVLLIKNYIIYTLVMVALMMVIYFGRVLAEKTIIQAPRVNRPLGGGELLERGEYENLTLKKLLGTQGSFEILDLDGNLIYTDREGDEEGYTARELALIPVYNTPYSYKASEYEAENGTRHTLVRCVRTEADTGYREDVSYMVLDEELHVIQGSPIWEDRQFTRHELELLTLSSDAKYSVYKYEFEERGKGSRILVMHIKKMDGQKYRRLSALWKIFIPVYICSYIFTLVFFTIRMRRKVQEPLDMLNEGILALAGGNRDTKISYKGPREFEAIFNSFNRMSGLLRESEDSKERLIMEKQKMLADISHDLKTPITVIRGYAKAVADGLTSPVTQKHYLNTIFTKTEDLTEMINAFYDYGKLEHPEFRLVKERQDLAEFIREYLAFKYDEIDLTGFEIEAEIPDGEVWYSFDGIQLRRVFDNIFSNALKHNPRGTTIYLTLQQTDRSIRIEIGDNGVGIPEEIRENLFDPFMVGDDSRNNRQGSGLGLAVAKKIVELHGGALFLEKPVNLAVSTLFVIRLMRTEGKERSMMSL